ncbi:DUF6048 family protein [Tenacibaculum sp. M341]|uniref:DUF6048 family protein n=1 Tax=Tenacibaculum sp. M341 TaxID=2530339 RepID=UPI0010EF3105|nr:DUF6048 family protein [Tenacibaculum sp. M341]TCI92766.1 hypothetical protein EYW44_07670 [Tenacibaculum sp. M341]
MRTLTFFIKLSIFLSFFNSYSQGIISKKKETKKDTIVYKTGYGIRVGLDISKPALGFIDKSYTGFELVGDYRISRRWYLAGEIGREEEITFEDFTTSTAKGNYIRLGANYNTYNNWLDMNNEIYVGGRYGLAIFEHTLNSYTPNVTTGDTNTDIQFPRDPITTPISQSGLNAHWVEFQLGIKAETFKNLFIGFHGAFKIALSIDDQEGFQTLYAPGFNTVNTSSTGFGFNYTISYLIPFTKK